MKKTIFPGLFLSFVFAMFTGLPAMAQPKNVDIDNLYCPVTYREMPAKPFTPLFFKYSTAVTATKSTEQRVSLGEIDDAINIAGQQRVSEDDNPMLKVALNLGNLIVVESRVSERKSEYKDKSGKVTVTYYYKVIVTYRFDSSYKIIRAGNVVANVAVYTSSNTHTYESKEYGNRKEAADFWNNNKDVLISEFTTNLSLQTASAASRTISSAYGFPVVKTSVVIETTDTKKHPENEAFRATCNSLKAQLGNMTPETGLNRDEIEEVIAYFKSIPEKYTDSKLKSDVKLRYAAYYNLCQIYLYLDEPEKVATYADLLIANDYDKKDGEKFKKQADELITTLTRTEIKTRHFDPEVYFEN